MKILVINGPNLNLLGTREPEIYGSLTLADIEQELKSLVTEKYSDVELMFFQSNIEGEIVDAIQKAKFEWNCNGILINPAAYTHTSVAIRDAISAVELPTVEVHISNIHQREEFRRNSFVSPVSIGQVVGFGLDSYKLGLIGLLQKL
jgi:3-dehydroquinate dehydratase-2